MTEPPHSAARRFAQFVLRFRWLWIVLTLVALGAAAAGFPRLYFNPDARVFFDEKNPDRIALDAFEYAFSRDDNVVFVFAPKNGDAFDPLAIQAVGEATDRLWTIPHVRRVNSLTNFSHSYDDGGIMMVNDLIMDPENVTPEELAVARDYALNQVETVNVVVSPDASVSAAVALMRLGGGGVAGQAKVDQLTAVNEVHAAVTELRADLEAKYGDQIDLYVTGIAMYQKQFATAAQADIQQLAMPMFLSIILIIGLSVRSAIGAGLTLLVAMLATAFAFGVTGFWEPALNSPKVNTMFVIPILMVAATTHLSAAIRQEMARSPDKRRWIENALTDHAWPISIAAITTMFGFLSLNFSISPPFRAFGNMTASGVIFGLFLTLFFMPALLSLLPLKRREEQASASRFAYWLGEFVIRNRTALMVGMLAVMVACLSGIPRLKLDDDFSRYFDERFQLRVETDFVQEKLTGMQQLEYSIGCGAPECIYDPEFLSKVDALTEWTRDQYGVRSVRSYTDTIKRIHSSFFDDDPEYYVIPDSSEAAAQLTLMYENGLQKGMDLTDQIDVNRESLRFSINMANVTSAETNAMEVMVADWFAENAPEIAAPATGMSHVFNLISSRDARSMLLGTFVALVLISGAMLFALRSVKLGLISLIPNLTPAAMALGVWGYTHGQVSLAIAVVIALTLGIVVDDSVHFLSKYARARREGKSSEDSVRYAFQSVGMALIVTTVGLTIGFYILSFSGFAVNAHLGELSAVTIALALAADFFLLPPLLMIIDKRKETPMTYAKPAAAAVGVLLAAGLAVGATAALAETPEQKGLRIAHAADQRDMGWGDMRVSGEMILRDPRGSENRRAFDNTALESRAAGQQGDKSMIVFQSPRDIRGTASLTHSNIEPQDDDQWLYLPALRRTKRISSSNRTGAFVGSEFTFEDLGSNEVGDYTYRWLRDEPCPGAPQLTCHVSDSFPVNTRSGYSRRTGWIDTQEYRLYQVQFFNRRNELEKVMTLSGYQLYAGRFWRASNILMRNLQTGKETEMRWAGYQFGAGLSESDFNPSRLSNASR